MSATNGRHGARSKNQVPRTERWATPSDSRRCWPAYGRMNQTCDQGASSYCTWPFQHPQRGGCVATPRCLTWIAVAALPGRGAVPAARSASAASKPG
jgi:hypothetical protein